jgi:hypothetical protein
MGSDKWTALSNLYRGISSTIIPIVSISNRRVRKLTEILYVLYTNSRCLSSKIFKGSAKRSNPLISLKFSARKLRVLGVGTIRPIPITCVVVIMALHPNLFQPHPHTIFCDNWIPNPPLEPRILRCGRSAFPPHRGSPGWRYNSSSYSS